MLSFFCNGVLLLHMEASDCSNSRLVGSIRVCMFLVYSRSRYFSGPHHVSLE